MEPPTKVTVRLSSERAAILQYLVDRGHYNDLSEVVSEAISEFVASKFTAEELLDILLNPSKEGIKIKSLSDGDNMNVDEAIKKAVKDYIRERIPPEE